METFFGLAVLFGAILALWAVALFIPVNGLEQALKRFKAKPESDPVLRDKQAALKWAASKGYPAPEEPWPSWIAIFGVTGLLLGAIPGIVIFAAMIWQSNKAKEQQRQLIMRWVDAGKPS